MSLLPKNVSIQNIDIYIYIRMWYTLNVFPLAALRGRQFLAYTKK